MAAISVLAAPAFAQDAPGTDAPVVANADLGRPVDFSADDVAYDSDGELVTASGQIRMSSEGNYLGADRVTWNRKTGEVVADGNVIVLTPTGDKLIGDHIVLTDDLRDGTVDNLLVVLNSGGRIAAAKGRRDGDVLTLENASYSACATTTATGCPRNPSWKISAARVTRDARTGKINFRGGKLTVLGVGVPLLPVFAISDGSKKGGVTGALQPNIRVDSNNGLELAQPYYFRIARNKDLTVTPHLYTGSFSALEAQWRQLTELGAYQVSGFVTYGAVPNSNSTSVTTTTGNKNIRGYIEANGKFQLDPYWSITTALRAATDKTVTRRYDLTRDDRFRSFINVERIDVDSYVSIAGWAFQGLRVDDVQKRIPIALPAIDARFRLGDPLLGGRIQLQLNSLAITRIDGQDTQRAFASVQWDMRRLTPWGQEVTFTALARGDVYHTKGAALTAVPIYRGIDGWHTRGIAALAADMRWPLVGSFLGGTQRLTPRVQIVATPKTENLNIPNEDSRAVDLEDSNLFALNRFPGYDRWEDGSRITYGVEWAFDRPNWSIDTVIGQSYRVSRRPSIFPDGTGLSDRFSDIVGRTRIRFGHLFDLTHRYRIDKDNLAVRRNELDLTVGTNSTFAQIGYLRLNRDIDASVEDLRDKEEIRVAGRWQALRYWSVYGSTIIDLTDASEDPLSLADGYRPVRHRIGFNYEDDCLELGVAWKRDYERIGSFKKGNTFSINFSLKGIGR